MLIAEIFNLYRHPPAGLAEHFALKAPTAVTVTARDGGAGYDLLIYDVIGCGCCEPEDIVAALAVAAGAPVRVRINSPGGDAFAGFAIHNLLAGYSGEVTVLVDGLAASAASYIAMAGSSIAMQPASFMMIHNGWVATVGDRNRLATQISALEKIDEAQRQIFADRSGMSEDVIGAMLDAETWFSSQEAVDEGLADEIVGNPAPQPELPDDGDEMMDDPASDPMSDPMGTSTRTARDIAACFAFEKRRRLLRAKLYSSRAK